MGRPDIEDLLRRLAPQVLGVVVRKCGDFDAAEDALQEALLAAALHWPTDGLPDNPAGWLVTTAVRKMADRVRSDVARRRREETTAREPAAPDGGVAANDDTLLLLLLCCHPSLTPPSAIALTLRAVGGLTTGEIGRAFLVPEATMAQRISRAKQKIRDAGATFEEPPAEDRPERLRSVLHVLYLMFNEGYTASGGTSLQRTDLSAEAMRLTRIVRAELPDDGEVTGLLALMLLTDARRPARTGADGQLIPLADQDRSLWDAALIEEGVALAVEAMSHGSVGEYQLQAAVAALHDEAPSAADTDWPQILALYTILERMSGNPTVTINRAIAAAMVHGPEAGLAMVAPLDGALGGSHRLDAVRAHLYEMAGDLEAAIECYRAAANRTTSTPEQQYLVRRAAELRALSAGAGSEPPAP